MEGVVVVTLVTELVHHQPLQVLLAPGILLESEGGQVGHIPLDSLLIQILYDLRVGCAFV